MSSPAEDQALRQVALRNAAAILRARQIAEDELEQRSSELASSLAMMQATLDASSDSLLVADRAGRITAVNDRFLQLWRVRRAVVTHSNHRELLALLAPQLVDPTAFVAGVMAIEAQAPFTSFDLLTFADGRIVERRSGPQVVAGHDIGRVWSFHDITEQRRAEDALREETRALDLLNSVGLRLAGELDLKALVQVITDAGREISGAAQGAFFLVAGAGAAPDTSHDVLSGPQSDSPTGIASLPGTPLFAATFRKDLVIRHDDLHRREFAGQWPLDGGALPQARSYLAVPVVGRSGQMHGGLFFTHPQPGAFSARTERLVIGLAAQAAVAIDNAHLYEAAQDRAREREVLLESERTARQMVEQVNSDLESRVLERTEALNIANRELESFAYSVSHDLRAPLSSIDGFTKALTDMVEHSLDERAQHYMARVRANIGHMSGLIDAMLALAQLSRASLNIVPLDLSAMARQVALELNESDPARRCDIVIEPDLTTDGDPALIQVVVTNLLRNAWKFTAKVPEARIDFARKGGTPAGMVVFEVSDNGAGFDMAFAARLFTPFQRLHKADDFPGTGVGLATVRRIVERHGGQVWATGQPGQGASFSFCLGSIAGATTTS